MNETKLEAEWKPDCQGKQDYDADLVRLSTRYYPRGGGFHTFDAGTREWAGNEARPEIKPSALATIYLQDEVMAEASFEGETEGAVKAQVETWAQQQFERIRAALRPQPVEGQPAGWCHPGDLKLPCFAGFTNPPEEAKRHFVPLYTAPAPAGDALRVAEREKLLWRAAELGEAVYRRAHGDEGQMGEWWHATTVELHQIWKKLRLCYPAMSAEMTATPPTPSNATQETDSQAAAPPAAGWAS